MKKRFLKIAALILTAAMLSACGKNVETQYDLKEASIAALKDGRYEEALAGFEEALTYAGGRVTDREIDICYYKAVTKYLLGDVDGACETLGSVITYDEKNSDAYFLRGSIYLSQGESDKGIADMRSSVETSGGDHERVIRVFSVLEEKGQKDAGLAIVSEALAGLSDETEDALFKGRLYILLEQYDDALNALTTAEGAGETEASVYLAKVLCEQGDESGARDKLSAYLASEAPTAEGIAAAGEEFMQMKDYDLAYDCFEQGITYYGITDDKEAYVPSDLTPETYRRLLADRVAASEFLGDWDDALKYAREYIALYPQDERMLEEIKFLATR